MKERDLLDRIAAGIRRCREAQGLTTERLAERSGVDAGFLAHIQVSAKKPSLNVLAKIIDGLGVAPEELFWSEHMTQKAIGKRIEALLYQLTPRQQKDMLGILGKLRRSEDIQALKVLLRA